RRAPGGGRLQRRPQSRPPVVGGAPQRRRRGVRRADPVRRDPPLREEGRLLLGRVPPDLRRAVNPEPLPPEIITYYRQAGEAARLLGGAGQVELARTQEIILRHLPPGRVVLDVRSEERRVGKACRSRAGQCQENK